MSEDDEGNLLAPAILSLGVGMFLFMFGKVLGR